MDLPIPIMVSDIGTKLGKNSKVVESNFWSSTVFSKPHLVLKLSLGKKKGK